MRERLTAQGQQAAAELMPAVELMSAARLCERPRWLQLHHCPLGLEASQSRS